MAGPREPTEYDTNYILQLNSEIHSAQRSTEQILTIALSILTAGLAVAANFLVGDTANPVGLIILVVLPHPVLLLFTVITQHYINADISSGKKWALEERIWSSSADNDTHLSSYGVDTLRAFSPSFPVQTLYVSAFVLITIGASIWAVVHFQWWVEAVHYFLLAVGLITVFVLGWELDKAREMVHDFMLEQRPNPAHPSWYGDRLRLWRENARRSYFLRS